MEIDLVFEDRTAPALAEIRDGRLVTCIIPKTLVSDIWSMASPGVVSKIETMLTPALLMTASMPPNAVRLPEGRPECSRDRHIKACDE
jgi:hypothetical protein